MKVRTSYVSNSSSSSYIIACKTDELVTRVIEMYEDTYDLMMKANPHSIGYGIDRCCYKLVSAEDIVKYFKEQNMHKDDLKYCEECFTEEESKGYKFLMANVASDDGTCEYEIVNMFNEYVLPELKGKYNWEDGKYEHDIELVFDTRWS